MEALLPFFSTLSTARKICVFNACITSKVLYCLHTAWLNKSKLRRLDVFQAICLRKILRIPDSFISRVSNDEILSRAQNNAFSKMLQFRQMISACTVLEGSHFRFLFRCLTIHAHVSPYTRFTLSLSLSLSLGPSARKRAPRPFVARGETPRHEKSTAGKTPPVTARPAGAVGWPAVEQREKVSAKTSLRSNAAQSMLAAWPNGRERSHSAGCRKQEQGRPAGDVCSRGSRVQHRRGRTGTAASEHPDELSCL